MTMNAHGLLDYLPSHNADEPGSTLGKGMNFFFKLNDLNDSIFTN